MDTFFFAGPQFEDGDKIWQWWQTVEQDAGCGRRWGRWGWVDVSGWGPYWEVAQRRSGNPAFLLAKLQPITDQSLARQDWEKLDAVYQDWYEYLITDCKFCKTCWQQHYYLFLKWTVRCHCWTFIQGCIFSKNIIFAPSRVTFFHGGPAPMDDGTWTFWQNFFKTHFFCHLFWIYLQDFF